MSIRWFSAEEVATVLTPARCIAAVEDALRLLGHGEAPGPATLAYPAEGGGFHIKAGRLGRYFAAKLNGNFPGNPARGLPTIQGLVILADATDGRLLAVMDSVELTARRTAAATAIAARLLARPDAARVAIIGCGVQAPAQLAALREVLKVTEVFAFDVDAARARAFADAHDAVVAGKLRDATLASDVVVTCTTSREFILFEEDVRPGTFIAAVGVDNEWKQEIAPELMARARIVTDVTAQCAQIGDLHHAIAAGVMTSAAVYGELPSLLAEGLRPDAGEAITIFDSTGIGLQDVAAAAAIYEAAIRS
jgi:ornithine cyclodeaminase/alanine dehydrogenase-like protein (mu-crystallin family)